MVIVGAGVAGLRAATLLSEAGVEALVLEASDDVGGRIRSDLVDGFRLDRGFQLLNPSYPQAIAALDLAALELRAFAPGLVVRDADSSLQVTDPIRRPSTLLEALRLRLGSVQERLRLGLLLGRLRFGSPGWLLSGADVSAEEWLRQAGVGDELIDGLLRPFLAGVLLESGLESSGHVVGLLLRSFLRGLPAVPAAGMQAIPSQMAGRLPPGSLRIGAAVHAVERSRAVLADGSVEEADVIVVATSAGGAAALLPSIDLRRELSVTTWWFATQEPLNSGARLVADRVGTVLVNSVELSAAAPSYAPPGRGLVAASALGLHGAEQRTVVVERLADLYRTDTASWELLRVDAIAAALPFSPPPWSSSAAPELEGIVVAGDHMATPSIQGAMASGASAAARILGQDAWRG